MKNINLNQYNRQNSLRIRKFGNEYFLLSYGKCYKVNEIGAIIVKYIGKDMTIENLSNSIANLYEECNIDQIAEDIKNFINFLLNEELVNQNE